MSSGSTEQFGRAAGELPGVPACLVGLLAVAVLLSYWSTTAAMVATWAGSGTFTHGFLVLPVVGWLLYRCRFAIAAATPNLSASGFILLALLAATWQVADRLGVQALGQVAVVLMIPALVHAVLGQEVLRAAAFPLFFALFAVPFGEFLLPPLMDLTANGSVALLALSGVPVFRDGWLISIPEGNFQVAEACSGIRYLIAALCTAVLFAWLFFRSWKKRFLFMAFTAFFTVLANVLRAYIIIFLARLSDMRLAVGVDHFVYGWFLFSVVLAVVLLVGLKFADAPGPVLVEDGPARVVAGLRAAPATFVAGSCLAAAILLSGPGLRAWWAPAAGAASSVPEQAGGARLVESAAPPDWLRRDLPVAISRYRYVGEPAFDLVEIRPADGGPDIGGMRPYVLQRRLALVADERPDGAGHAVMRLESAGDGLVIGYWFTVGGRQTANLFVAKIMEAVTMMGGEHQKPALIAVALETNKLEQPMETLRRLMPEVMEAYAACQAGAPRAPAGSTKRCRLGAATTTG